MTNQNKATFLVELGTEELPPKALKKLGQAFYDETVNGLQQAGLEYSEAKWFASPRRLAIQIKALDTKQADQTIERKGPAVKAAYDADGNPTKAALGFAKSCGIDINDVQTQETDKGAWLIHKFVKSGEAADQLLPSIVDQALAKLPIPKRMTWGNHTVAFVRPVHWLVMLLDSNVIPCEILGQQAGNQTRGHRFHCPDSLVLNHADDYEKLLSEKAYVIADFAERRTKIKQQVIDTVTSLNGEADLDEDLLDEVTGLVEWPVALSGQFDEAFLKVPAESLISAMKEHQKYFPVRSKSDGSLLNRFITVSNIESQDASLVIEGNEKVIRPRLSDAKFFYDTDLKMSLEAFNSRLEKVIFQKQLGSVKEKAERVSQLAKSLAPMLGAEPSNAERAGLLCKADLATNMVGEFPELQGIMGRYYAKAQGENDEVAAALDEQYQPRFAGDDLPQTLTGCAVSLAEKLDTLVGIFGIGQKPSGDKDPFALRRAALGILRITIEKGFDLPLDEVIDTAQSLYGDKLTSSTVKADLLAFFTDRYRPFYQQQGLSTDAVIAVEALNPTNPKDFDQRVKAVAAFKALAEADALAAANKRVGNILKKSDVDLSAVQVDESLLTEDQEQTLHKVLSDMEQTVAPLFKDRQYQEALQKLASLRDPIDAFFDSVMVNVEDPATKTNRLALLQKLRGLFLQVADISSLAL